MSETSKMGLFGSKEDNTSSNTGQLNKDESPERYAPYSVDSDSETYDTEALSIMDINDIIGVQTEPVGDSTLESEIAALTEIITDTNIPEATAEDPMNRETNMTTATANVDMLVSIEEKKAGPSGETVINKSSKDSQLRIDESTMNANLNINEITYETTESTSINVTQPLDTKDNKEVNESTYSKDVTAICKSLQLIGEAYDSDDSQDSDADVMQIGKEPKVIFSCKPFVEKQLCKVPDSQSDSCEIVQNKIIHEPAKDSTSVTEDTVVIENVQEIKEVEKKDDDASIKESTDETITENNECKTVVDESKTNVGQDPIEVIVDAIPNVKEILSEECNEASDEQKSPIEPVNDCIKAGSTPVIEDIVSLPDNQNHGIVGTNNAIIVELDQEIKPTSKDGKNMEARGNENASADGDVICEISQSTSQLGPRENSEHVEPSDDVNKNVGNDALEYEEPTAVLVAESDLTVEITLAKEVENIDENLIEMEEKKTENVKSTEEISNAPCESSDDINQITLAPAIDEVAEAVISDQTTEDVVPDKAIETVESNETTEDVKSDNTAEDVESNETIEPVLSDEMTDAVVPDEPIKAIEFDETTEAVVSDEMTAAIESGKTIETVMDVEMTETAVSDKTPVVDTQEVVSSDDRLAEVDAMQEDILEIHQKSEITSELKGEHIVDEEETLECPLVNKQLEECANFSKNIVNAISSTNFPMEDENSFPSEAVQKEKSPDDVVEKMDVELDNKGESLEVINNVKKIIDDKNLSNPDIPPDQETVDEDSGAAIKVTPDPNSHKLNDNITVGEEQNSEIIEKAVDAISNIKKIQPETKETSNELSSTNISAPPSAPESDKQTIPALQSTNSESVALHLEANTIEDVKGADINTTNPKKITPQHVEASGVIFENHLPDVLKPMENISNTIHNISDSKSILDNDEIQGDENVVTEPLTLCEDNASTTNKVIDDIKQNLFSQSTEILQNALEDPMSIHTDDSLDAILDLDLIPNIDDTEIKTNEPIMENVIENIPEAMDIIDKESTLDLQLSEPEIAAVNQVDDFLSDVIDTIRESENKTADADAKMESEPAIDTVLSLNRDDDEEKEAGNEIELRKEPVQVNSPIANTDTEEPELDTPFTLTQEDKLEIPDDILSEPLATVESGIEVLQGNSEISELESAVKFLQDSEDHEIESPTVLSSEIDVDMAAEIGQREDSATVYPPNQEICEDSSDLITELESIKAESIAISEAEIINEAVKLESERKLTEELSDSSAQQSNIERNKTFDDSSKDTLENESVKTSITVIGINIDDATIKGTQSIFPVKSSIIPKTSILEERLKEPPKIEIPIVDSPRLCDMPTTPKTSLLIPRDSRMSNYQKMMESPKSSMEKSIRDEMKIIDTSRKDSDKHEIENVGSPRIILKIAKSALADCAEPRSPKSPKIRSATNSPNPEDSPGQKLGKIKLKLSKGGHPSIIPNDNMDEPALQWYTEGSSSLSPLGMKIKLSKSGDASIVQHELKETPKHMLAGSPRRTESPFGMKIKLSKSGDASIIQTEKTEDETSREIKTRERTESPQDMVKRTDSPLGMKIKLLTTGDASIVSSDYDESKDLKMKEKCDTHQDNERRMDSHMAMKIKLSKKGGASIVPTNDSKEKVEMPKSPRRTDSPLGMKIKLSKTGDASIVHSELLDDQISSSSHETTIVRDGEPMAGSTKRTESSIGMKIKFSKDGDATIVRSEKQQEEEQPDMKRIDSTIGMKIKLSKSGDASIIQSQINEMYEERSETKAHKSSDTTTIESMKIRLSKTGHGTIVANDTDTSQRSKEFIETHHIFSQKREALVNRSEVTIEPIQLMRRSEVITEIPPKRKDSVTLSPIETKKSKMDANLSQMLPELTIQPVLPRDQKPINFEQSNSSTISRQQMNVISQEISITQLRPNKSNELSVSEKLRKILTKPPVHSAEECVIIEHHPELIIVNENSNSSQDIMIIDEVPPLRVSEIKTPKKRGRPRRTAISIPFQQPDMQMPTDPLALDNIPRKLVNNLAEQKDNERPRRTCRSQKSYAPPKRGRGRGRGKRKFDKIDSPVGKRARMEQNLTAMEDCSTALITLDDEVTDEVPNDSSELYKALRQPLKVPRMDLMTQNPVTCTVALKNRVDALLEPRLMARMDGRDCETTSVKANQVQLISDDLKKDPKDVFGTPDHQNWLTPSSKKYVEVNRNDGISTVQVIDEETRMSADSFSRSQTPARNMSVNAAETTINEESQGSVLSTATTESEKVKVKNRRMEISFDPDEGPFTVDKIAEYEWPTDRKGETFMIQEQISQYLGVKSFKRKYPDLKRRMVDMEERNYLRENGLVSEAMCDMGLTAIYSSEVLDIMCSDFPDQYEEYRKHMREKQIKEHSKKQKELSAAATAEKNRIDLAEMAVQSALSWNVNLNKARRESRRCSLDLQSFTIHVPKKLQKIEEESKVSHYPVALIPGQYTDYYREYTPAELRYYPLNTVLYGPMRPNERKFDSQSEGSQSDSDSDSSSDDSSCSSSEGTQDTEESQSTMDDVDIELSNQKDKSLKCKMCLKHLNKISKPEVLIQCGTCSGHVHPSCIDLTLDMVPHIQAYAWQCTDCKTCVQCHDPADEDKMLFCDMCDRGYHIYCVGLRRVPQGRWHCQECAICASCGSREAGGVNADRNSVALWQHEYKKGDKNTRVYVSTLCVPCSKLWRKGRYCPHCSRCHTVPRLDMEENLVHCSACDKYLHLDCVESKVLTIDRKNYQCDLCIQNRQRIVKPSVSKVIRA